jgi:hypothetical protein
MTNHPGSPPIKSLSNPPTDQRTPATPHPVPDPCGLEGRRPEGRPSCSSTTDQPAGAPGDGRQAIAWLTITAPTSWRRVPTARSWCRCGYERTATGTRAVLRLIEGHTAHRDHCPLRNPTGTRKAA